MDLEADSVLKRGENDQSEDGRGILNFNFWKSELLVSDIPVHIIDQNVPFIEHARIQFYGTRSEDLNIATSDYNSFIQFKSEAM